MICAVINGPTFEEARQQIAQAAVSADLVELRLDCFSALKMDALNTLRSQFSIPMIFTLRSQSHGGNYDRSEEERLTAILSLMELEPEYFDLENHVTSSIIDTISSRFPEIRLILSYHNFNETPADLEKIYQEMKKAPAFFYKIAMYANNCLDAMRLICWAKQEDDRLIAISMGPHGQISRILGPLIKSPITYAALEEDQQTVSGQLSVKSLIERYHYRCLNPSTTIYGLIGDPVHQSISDETHNHLMEVCHLNSVYLKIKVKPGELKVFLEFAKQLPFHGLSVTMPLKEHILPFLDEIDSKAAAIGAVNTLLFDNGKIFGFNTDCSGALNAIEKDYTVKGKKIMIIGAGGAAKAIAYEAQRRGGLVTIVSRNAKKALEAARGMNCKSYGLDNIEASSEARYDIIINCTPVCPPIAFTYILPQTIVMDITTKPKETLFLQHAKEKGCRVIYGYQMFIEQALGQFKLWSRQSIDMDQRRKILEKRALQALFRQGEH